MSRGRNLIVVAGATASGKTGLSLELAGRFAAPVLSADSRQIYRGMPIGTAQPTAEELARAEHHFIAERDIHEDYTCGRYEADALERLESLFSRHEYVIAVGGSGLYIDALCHGLDSFPAVDPELRRTLGLRLRERGLDDLLGELRRRDPVYYDQVDRANPVRVQRALEVIIQTGMPYSALRSGRRRERPFRIVKIGTERPREELYARIDLRTEQMMAAGLEEEARRLYPWRSLNALQTVGYRELFDCFDGRTTLGEAVELIKRNTRRYAKRQLTWFRRDGDIAWFPPDDLAAIVGHIRSACSSV